MPDWKTAFIFPAFPYEYPEDPSEILPGFSRYFKADLDRAAGVVDPKLKLFHYRNQDFLSDELRTQYMTYILGCSFSEFCRERSVRADYSAGFSLGIYAALYDAGAVTFENGLVFIQSAFEAIKTITAGEKYGMGTVIGLSREDLEKIIGSHFTTIEITNQNSVYSFLVSGKFYEINRFLSIVRDEGALHTRNLMVSVPYHSSYIRDAAPLFEKAISTLGVKKPGKKIISLIDQSLLETPDAIRTEIVRNIHTHLNWYRTQQTLQGFGVNRFLECGLNGGLVKNARFIEGEFRFLEMRNALDLVNKQNS